MVDSDGRVFLTAPLPLIKLGNRVDPGASHAFSRANAEEAAVVDTGDTAPIHSVYTQLCFETSSHID
jgi:hypothetical protein